ncbi:hypothetical protein ULB03_00850 [Nitrospirillum sp. BR 11828]|nr:hypothetical protein [Nitrospirillum sp. BR 11828]MDZ5645706.1 hypothetical protein [Nitrospirillum sp. BR 11828]
MARDQHIAGPGVQGLANAMQQGDVAVIHLAAARREHPGVADADDRVGALGHHGDQALRDLRRQEGAELVNVP